MFWTPLEKKRKKSPPKQYREECVVIFQLYSKAGRRSCSFERKTQKEKVFSVWKNEISSFCKEKVLFFQKKIASLKDWKQRATIAIRRSYKAVSHSIPQAEGEKLESQLRVKKRRALDLEQRVIKLELALAEKTAALVQLREEREVRYEL